VREVRPRAHGKAASRAAGRRAPGGSCAAAPSRLRKASRARAGIRREREAGVEGGSEVLRLCTAMSTLPPCAQSISLVKKARAARHSGTSLCTSRRLDVHQLPAGAPWLPAAPRGGGLPERECGGARALQRARAHIAVLQEAVTDAPHREEWRGFPGPPRSASQPQDEIVHRAGGGKHASYPPSPTGPRARRCPRRARRAP
jgi:hypothetical protein